MTDLVWQIPLMALGAVFAVRLLLAPYWIYQERDKQATDTEERLHNEIKQKERVLQNRERRKYLREQLGIFYREGHDIKWSMAFPNLQSTRDWNSWLKRVPQFLKQEPEFDDSHLARFETAPLDAIHEFIKDFTD